MEKIEKFKFAGASAIIVGLAYWLAAIIFLPSNSIIIGLCVATVTFLTVFFGTVIDNQ